MSIIKGRLNLGGTIKIGAFAKASTSVQLVQTALNDDIYAYPTFDNYPTVGNMVVSMFTNWNLVWLPEGWTVLQTVESWGFNVEGIGIAYRFVTEADALSKSIQTLSTNRAEGAAVVFEVSGVDASMIDSYGAIARSAAPSVTATVTPTTSKTLVLGMVTPAGFDTTYPQSMTGADVYMTYAQYGDHDGFAGGHTPAVFKTTLNGAEPRTITATYALDQTIPLNIGYIAFKV